MSSSPCARTKKRGHLRETPPPPRVARLDLASLANFTWHLSENGKFCITLMRGKDKCARRMRQRWDDREGSAAVFPGHHFQTA